MAASIPIEEDSGTFAGHLLSHRGYYAGGLVSRIDRSARAHVPLHHVAGTDAAGAQLHQQLARADLRHGQFDDAHIIVGVVFYG